MRASPRAVLAIDHGTKRTGFAISDPLRITREPLEVFHGPGDGQELIDHIAAMLEERVVGTFVVGLPLIGDGEEGPQALEVRAFIARLGARFPEVAVVTRDERLTTKEAEDRLREAGHHGRERKRRRDSWSALVILDEWLDAGEPAG